MFPHRFATLFARFSPIAPLACVCLALPAQAEGSRDLVSSGGDRPFLEYRNDANVGIPRQTTLKVFARVGETINLGSSATGMGAATIRYRRPSGGAQINCGAGVGLIPNRDAEMAGPFHAVGNTATNAFTPCVVTVGAGDEGIWEIEFTSPDPGNTAYAARPTITSASSPWTQSTNAYWIAAWDVTVRNGGGQAIPGRVFANYLALNLGDNGASLSSNVYLKTHDGYGYRIDMNGLDPFGFIFFANNKGFRNQSTNNPIYRSLQLTNQDPELLPPGYNIQMPFSPDVPASRDFTHKIFFADPDPSMPGTANSPLGTTWLNQNPVPPPTPTNLSFIGLEGTVGQAGTNPLGGFFRFTATEVAPFDITLDLNENNIYGDGNDRTLVGTTVNGVNSVLWDGKDGNGVPVPAGNSQYDFQVELKAGEIHFPFIDPENNPGGLIIQRVRDAGTNPTAPAFEVMYDDRYNFTSAPTSIYDYSLCAGSESPNSPVGNVSPSCYGTIPSTIPSSRSALGGVLSTAGAHRWENRFGDRRGMNTWANYPSASIRLADAVVVREADLSVTKTDGLTTTTQGATLTYTITVNNAGPSSVVGATVLDTMPSQLESVTWTCTASSGSSCPASGSGTINAMVNILNGGSLTFSVTAIVSPTAPSGTLTNSARVLRPNDVNDPTDPTRTGAGNNTATDVTTIVGSPLTVTKAATLVEDRDGSGNGAALASQTATPGDVLNYTIVTTNPGTTPVTGVILRDTLPATLTYLPGSLTIVGANAGAKTDAPGDDQAELSGSQVVARLGTGATATQGGSLAAGTTTIVTFRVVIRDPAGANLVSNQAIVESLGNPPKPSDDPSTSPLLDPTVTPLAPRLRLVKRMTGIKKVGVSAVTPLGSYYDLVGDGDDDGAVAWPGGATAVLLGAINESQVLTSTGLPAPQDEVEYTIYFLADGARDAQNVNLCDFIPANQTLVPGTIELRRGTIVTPIGDVPAGVGASGFYTTGLPAACPIANNNGNGAVYVNVGLVPTVHSIPASTPSFGYFRFRATVN